MLDQKHFSAEQIDFLDKFFKDNPWADNAQLESIVKATGLAEPIIKVKLNGKKTPLNSSHLQAYIDQRRAKWNSMYNSNSYLNYNTNEFSADLSAQSSFHNGNAQFLATNSMKNDYDVSTSRMFERRFERCGCSYGGRYFVEPNELFCSSSTSYPTSAAAFPIPAHASGRNGRILG